MKQEMKIASDLPEEVRGKFAKLVTESFQEGLTVLEGVTTTDPKRPHRLEASIEWVSLYARGGQSPVLGSCAIRVNSTLHMKEGEGWKAFPGHCESYQLDVSNTPESEIEDDIHDGVLMIQFRVYEATMSIL